PCPPAELEQEQVVHPAAEYKPARVPVAGQMAPQAGDSKHRLLHGGPFGDRALGHRLKNLDLFASVRVRCWSVRCVTCEVSKEKQSPCDLCKYRERVEQTVRA